MDVSAWVRVVSGRVADDVRDAEGGWDAYYRRLILLLQDGICSKGQSYFVSRSEAVVVYFCIGVLFLRKQTIKKR